MADVDEQQAEEYVRGLADSKTTIPSFFKTVVKSDSTIKTANVDITELGYPTLPVRTDLKLAVFCDKIFNQTEWSNYFKEMAEITTSSSLGKDGFLLKQVTTSKREVADTTPERKPNKGSFGFNKKKQEEPQ
jgi:hypothetical protein